MQGTLLLILLVCSLVSTQAAYKYTFDCSAKSCIQLALSGAKNRDIPACCAFLFRSNQYGNYNRDGKYGSKDTRRYDWRDDKSRDWRDDKKFEWRDDKASSWKRRKKFDSGRDFRNRGRSSYFRSDGGNYGNQWSK